jgi:hypothetical protein
MHYDTLENTSESEATSAEAAISVVLFILVSLSRYFTRGRLYYVDGPRLVQSIRHHTYVIQAPGYWLYAHLGGLFPDPAAGLSILNIIFSGAGASVFYLLGRKFGLPLKTSFLAALAYSSIFFLWFAGDVHSSYASQILFAPLTIYLFVSYCQKPSRLLLTACCASYAAGAGLRPSDGAFLGPLFLFMTFRFISGWKTRVTTIFLTCLLCLAWYVPTKIALTTAHSNTVKDQLASLAFQVSPLLVGINARSVANVIRVLLPILVAFWMLIPTLFSRRASTVNWILALWAFPGLFFFTLIYMADACYLTFLAGAIILTCALSSKKRYVPAILTTCFLFNSSVFLLARPVSSRTRAAQALNFYVIKYCHYGIRHQWSSTIGSSTALLSQTANEKRGYLTDLEMKSR